MKPASIKLVKKLKSLMTTQKQDITVVFENFGGRYKSATISNFYKEREKTELTHWSFNYESDYRSQYFNIDNVTSGAILCYTIVVGITASINIPLNSLVSVSLADQNSEDATNVSTEPAQSAETAPVKSANVNDIENSEYPENREGEPYELDGPAGTGRYSRKRPFRVTYSKYDENGDSEILTKVYHAKDREYARRAFVRSHPQPKYVVDFVTEM